MVIVWQTALVFFCQIGGAHAKQNGANLLPFYQSVDMQDIHERKVSNIEKGEWFLVIKRSVLYPAGLYLLGSSKDPNFMS